MIAIYLILLYFDDFINVCIKRDKQIKSVPISRLSPLFVKKSKKTEDFLKNSIDEGAYLVYNFNIKGGAL